MREQGLDQTTTEAPVVRAGGSLDEAEVWLVAAGSSGSLRAQLAFGAEVVVGRAARCDLSIDDPGLSRFHARFVRDARGLRVEDLGSRNGTFHEGERVEAALLSAGDSVRIGDVCVLVQVLPSLEAIATGLCSLEEALARLHEELARASAFGRPLSVVALRPVRSGYVHVRTMAARARAIARKVDIVARDGRDSLLVISPEACAREAAELAQKLVAPSPGIARLAGGVATFPAAGGDAESLVRAARDAADRAAEAPTQEPASGVATAPRVTHGSGDASSLILASEAIRELYRSLDRLAPSSLPILILGETGVGKDVAAREVHARSGRVGPLRILSMDAQSDALLASTLFGHVRGAFTGAVDDRDGVFVQAHGGTLVLDHVAELSAAAQAALLRVLETRRVRPVGAARDVEVDVRIIALSRPDLFERVERGTFRRDLLHRLNAATVEIPPLRARMEELDAYVDAALRRERSERGRDITLAPAALETLRNHSWPGNARELDNALRRAAALCRQERITREDLPPAVRGAREDGSGQIRVEAPLQRRALARSLWQEELRLVREALEATGGDRAAAAERLRISERTLYRRLSELKKREASEA